MKEENAARDKSFLFAIRIVNLCNHLVKEKKEYVLSKQLLKSGTSIGANIEESIGGQSDKDFLSKISISYKEIRETIYWIRLLHATGYLTNREMKSIRSDAEELIRIIGSIQISQKKKISENSKVKE